MVQNKIIQLLLLPFSLLFGIGISLRNLMYESGLLKSTKFDIPVINIGNLSIGGTGKTPHIEYLIQLLDRHLNLATLSRGYKRKSKGFRFAELKSRVSDVGDEPLVFKRKYRDVIVAVSESREVGIPQILQYHDEVQLILLDDAFQHRSVQAGLNILLTEFERPFTEDYLLPSGRLREWRSSYKRADIIIVTKCPKQIDENDRNEFIRDLKPLRHQRIFFSYYEYLNPYYIFNPKIRIHLRDVSSAVLVSAIAHTNYLYSSLSEMIDKINPVFYEDHHYFSNHDLSQIKLAYDHISDHSKVIITTEKDAVRLAEHREFIMTQKLPIYLLPIQIKFHFGGESEFNEIIKQFLLNFKV